MPRASWAKRNGLRELRIHFPATLLRDVQLCARLDGDRSIRSLVESVLAEGVRKRLRAIQLLEREARKRQAREDAAANRPTVELVADDTPDEPGEVADIDA